MLPSFAKTASPHCGRRRSRFYLILGSSIVMVELFLSLWGYQIVTKYDDSMSAGLQQQMLSNGGNSRNHDRSPDGYFNGFPVYYHDLTLDKTYHSRPYSSVRCVGENYQGEAFAWMHRSCHFRFLCLNISSREFEIYSRPDDEILQSIVNRRRPFMDLSASVIPPPRVRSSGFDENTNITVDGVSLGSGTVRYPAFNYDNDDYERDRSRPFKETYNWFPTVVESSPPERFYALEEDFVFVPFNSAFMDDEGRKYSVLWDDLFPIYTLLNMFQLASSDTRKEALLMRYVPLGKWTSKPGRTLGEVKGMKNDDQMNVRGEMHPFRPLMTRGDSLLKNTSWTSQVDAILLSSDATQKQEEMLPLTSGLVCAKDGVAGLGPHGIQNTSEKNKDDILNHHGKGGLLWRFRNYCIHNLGLLTSSLPVIRDHTESSGVESTNSSIRIIFSAPVPFMTSGGADVNILPVETIFFDFESIKMQLQKFLSLPMDYREEEKNKKIMTGVNDHAWNDITNDQIEIELHDFLKDDVNITGRVKMIMDTAVLIATCSDDAVATDAIFLPRGASLIVFYNTNDINNGDGGMSESTTASACLGYRDLLNNLSHVVVHWLPTKTMQSEEGRKFFFSLVNHAIKIYNMKKS